MTDKISDAAPSHLTRPIVGIENRSAQEVFDIMCDRFKAYRTAANPLQAVLDKFPAPAPVSDLPWRESDIKRGLILFRTSNNAHGYTNVSILSEKVDGLPKPAKEELAGMMVNIAKGLSPDRTAQMCSPPAPVSEITEEMVERLCFAAVKYAPALGGNYNRALYTPEAAALRSALTAAMGGK